ncbi:hypothetical protein [Pseudobacillus wudalianchiensis]|uniref:hypothetical protein n=1 Tax=Pseudobacillus wudalianchiensis TaxID=1743143 RepID=UPI00159F0DAE|nr:hypothetical protein [Bacillus wudalianchiensis]
MRTKEKVTVQELKRQSVIEQLLGMGISQSGNVSVQEMGYIELRRLLTVAVLKKGS